MIKIHLWRFNCRLPAPSVKYPPMPAKISPSLDFFQDASIYPIMYACSRKSLFFADLLLKRIIPIGLTSHSLCILWSVKSETSHHLKATSSLSCEVEALDFLINHIVSFSGFNNQVKIFSDCWELVNAVHNIKFSNVDYWFLSQNLRDSLKKVNLRVSKINHLLNEDADNLASLGASRQHMLSAWCWANRPLGERRSTVYRHWIGGLLFYRAHRYWHRSRKFSK